MLQVNIYKEIINSSDEELNKKTKGDLGTLIWLAIERKISDSAKEDEVKLIDEGENYMEVTDYLLKNNSVFRKIYDLIQVEEDEEGDLDISSSEPGFLSFINSRLDSFDTGYFEKRRIELESALINICISFESFVSKMLKDIYNNFSGISSLKKRNLTFEELLKIGDIDSARNYIIDAHVDDLFRGSFLEWINETVKTFSASSSFDTNSTLFNSIHELYQRRNLFVHTEGIVNSYYIKNVPNNNFNVGEKISLTETYLNDKIKDVVELSWLLYDVYLQKKYKDKGFAFDKLNGRLLKHISSGYDVIGNIFNKYALEKFPEDEEVKNKLARVNYYLYCKLNGKYETIECDLQKFNVSYLSDDFKIAKCVLLETDNYLEDVKNHIDNLDDSSFFEEIDWPIFKACKANKEIANIMYQRLIKILGDGEDEKSQETGEDNDNNQKKIV